MKTKTVKALPVSIYRTYGHDDCTNGGMSARREQAYLISDVGFDVNADNPGLLRLETVHVGRREYLHVVPVNPEDSEGKLGPMFGGNFVYSSDSRFPSPYPIPIHDRFETQFEYDHLSL